MKVEKNILVAFILNLLFSVIEIIGGLFTNSTAILSDSIHDFGDSLSIGISYFLEKKSKRKPDSNYTYGYLRYSVLGALITNIILFVGSVFMIYESMKRIINPVQVNYNGMFIFAILGVIINFLAAYFTSNSHSMNEKAVNLHMLEDIFGWLTVLIGSVIIKFTNILIIDPLISIVVSVFILYKVLKNCKLIIDIFLEKTPKNISVNNIKEIILSIENVINIHHVHIWSLDGLNNYATMHVVVNKPDGIKNKIREELKKYGVNHVTIEFETEEENCKDTKCSYKKNDVHKHHH